MFHLIEARFSFVLRLVSAASEHSSFRKLVSAKNEAGRAENDDGCMRTEYLEWRCITRGESAAERTSFLRRPAAPSCSENYLPKIRRETHSFYIHRGTSCSLKLENF